MLFTLLLLCNAYAHTLKLTLLMHMHTILGPRYNLGNRSEMLVVVRQDDSSAPIRVDFITDRADKLVLHWGATKPGTCFSSCAPR